MKRTPAKLTPAFTVSQQQVGLSAGRPVRAQLGDTVNGVPPHNHTYYEICVIHAGEAIHQTEFFEAPVRHGSVVVIPPGKVHAFVNGDKLHGTNVYYLTEWLLSGLDQLWEQESLVPLFLADSLFPHSEHAKPFQFDLNAREYEAVMIDLEDMRREWNESKPSVLYMETCFLKLLILLSRSYARQAPEETGFRFRRPVWLAIESIEATMLHSQSLSVSQLARQLNLSTHHFARLFREATGWTPTEYFQMRRVQHACKMLLNRDHNISEVAYRLGYSDSAHLSRMFKRYRGMSPREYRRMYVSKAKATAQSEPSATSRSIVASSTGTTGRTTSTLP